jgi:hypothetical protein
MDDENLGVIPICEIATMSLRKSYRQFLVERRRDRIRDCAHVKGVAVGRCFRGGGGGDRVACTRTVFHHDRLSPQLVQPGGENAAHAVGGTARRGTHEQPYGLVRICGLGCARFVR